MNESAAQHVDVAIIGAGTAGLNAYRAAVAVTDRVLLIEGGAVGTTCARVGCMPSKLLIAAAEAAHAVARAHRFGVGEPGAARVDGTRVMERVRQERDHFVGLVAEAVEAIPAKHWLRGSARFADAHTLVVGNTTIYAKAIVVATGSRASILPQFAELGDRLVVSDDVFEWRTLPASVAVFGPGIVGLELGQALHRLGVRVRIFGHGGLVGPLTDPNVREEARRILADEVPLHPDPEMGPLRREGNEVVVTFKDAGRVVTERFEFVLAATGRAPNLDRLRLDHTGLDLDAHGVPSFDRATLRCGASAIFLAGDANADVPVLHEASDEGTIAGRNAARFPEIEPGLRRSAMSIVFTDPQIASVGASWEEVRRRDPIVGRVSFEDQGRSRVMLADQGLLHLYVDRQTGRFLGAEMVGPQAEHLAHLLAWSHQLSLTAPQMLTLPIYHPVVEEVLRTALRDAVNQLYPPNERISDD